METGRRVRDMDGLVPQPQAADKNWKGYLLWMSPLRSEGWSQPYTKLPAQGCSAEEKSP